MWLVFHGIQFVKPKKVITIIDYYHLSLLEKKYIIERKKKKKMSCTHDANPNLYFIQLSAEKLHLFAPYFIDFFREERESKNK